MSLFQLTIDKIFLLVASLINLVIGESFYLFKSIILILALILSFFLVWLWFKYELKNRDEIDKWITYFKFVAEYFFLKQPKKNFEKIKKIFYQDKILALKELNEFLNFVLETLGYEGSFEEKFAKINSEILPNLEDLKKAFSICQLIEEKLKNNEEINLNTEDYLLIFHTYEVALKDLNIIGPEDFLVTNLK